MHKTCFVNILRYAVETTRTNLIVQILVTDCTDISNYSYIINYVYATELANVSAIPGTVVSTNVTTNFTGQTPVTTTISTPITSTLSPATTTGINFRTN